MPQFKRIGTDWTAEMENPDPRFWEPIAADTKPAPATPAQSETSK